MSSLSLSPSSSVKTGLVCFWLLASVGCAPDAATEGGANANDRSSGGDGELLGREPELFVSPRGHYAIAADGAVQALVDLDAGTSRALAAAGDRFVFSRTRDVVYVTKPARRGVVAIDLVKNEALWTTTPAFSTTSGSFLLRVTLDDRALLVGDYDRIFVLDPDSGAIKKTARVGDMPVDLEVLPDQTHALSVGITTWDATGPHTPVSLIDFEGSLSSGVTIDVPNCAAPIAVVRGGSRALLSPTFCQPGMGPSRGSAPDIRPPDPVSVIDVDAAAGQLHFVKNLPGFGPVALLGDGPDATSAVAYVDRDRIDPAMFADPAQIPPKDGPKHYLMIIEPSALTYSLHAIGEALPRFAPSKDGRSLLVDATVTLVRTGEIKASFGPNGFQADATVSTFGNPGVFGVFDVGTAAYAPLAGVAASLDRFVQQGTGRRIVTRKASEQGRLYAIDLDAKTSEDLGRSVKDLGLLADGTTVVLWENETLCLTADGRTCTRTISTTSSTGAQ